MPIKDFFSAFTKGLTSPADEHFAVVPDDNNDLSDLPRCLYINGAGTLTIIDKKGTQETYEVNAGIFQFRPVRVLATGTTATGIKGWL